MASWSWLSGFSTHIIPKPADWDEYQHLTGYWFLDTPADWQPALELTGFLENGPPPIYVGLDSMDMGDAVTDSTLRARAAALGEKIRAEDGIGRAVEVIERHAAGFRPLGVEPGTSGHTAAHPLMS